MKNNCNYDNCVVLTAKGYANMHAIGTCMCVRMSNSACVCHFLITENENGNGKCCCNKVGNDDFHIRTSV